MSGESIYVIACEMLQTTNPFNKGVLEIRYSRNGSEEQEVSLMNLVNLQSRKFDHRHRGKSDENLKRAYTAISTAMVAYLEEYPVVFSFKQITRRNFKKWLNKISEVYGITDQKVPDELKKDETDTGVAMLKLLHSREGVTYDEFHAELDITERAIQKNLVKLSPELYTGPSEAPSPYTSFRLGGQELRAKITLIDPKASAKEKRFFTQNTIHPLVLQENITQLATLLKALCHQFDDYGDDISIFIAVDIWSQMSEYARKKIKRYFAFGDPAFTAFIETLEYDCPDDHVCIYRTEKELFKEIELPIDTALSELAKVPGRKATIVLKTGEHIHVQELHQTSTSDGKAAYQAIETNGEIKFLVVAHVEEVIMK